MFQPQPKKQVVPWTKYQRILSWLSFAVFFVGFIFFIVGFTGNSWYVSPVVNNRYPPDNPIDPIHFGLFYMCFRSHCKYDLQQDYQIVLLLPPELGQLIYHIYLQVLQFSSVIIYPIQWRNHKMVASVCLCVCTCLCKQYKK